MTASCPPARGREGPRRPSTQRGSARRPILVCLAGLSPAVVTEAAYALAVRSRPPIVPDEIYIVATSDASSLVARTLLGPDGAIARLIREYGLPATSLRCDLDHVFLLQDEHGRPLADIRTTAESRAAGEQIAALLRRLRRDPAVELHCSLAGGRKTMGALLACALQLVARRGDRLYHVLVDKRFEALPSFFYPPRRSEQVRAGECLVDARSARVDLAEIPIVRLGAVADLLGVHGDLPRRVAQVEAAMDQQFRPPPLQLQPDIAAVAADGIVLRLPPADFALFALYAWLRRRCRVCRATGQPRCEGCHPTDDEIFDWYRNVLATFWRRGRRRPAPAFERLLAAHRTDHEGLLNFREWIRQARSRLLRRLSRVDAPFPWRSAYGLVSEHARRGLRLPPDLIKLSSGVAGGVKERGSADTQGINAEDVSERHGRRPSNQR